MTRPTDDDIKLVLRELPRVEPSPGFTERVVARLDGAAASPRRTWRRWLAPVAAMLVLGSWLWSGSVREREARSRSRAKLEEMRREYRALSDELERLRSLAAEADPVLDLGGTEDVDFVFDLRRFADERGRAGAEPVSLRRE